MVCCGYLCKYIDIKRSFEMKYLIKLLMSAHIELISE